MAIPWTLTVELGVFHQGRLYCVTPKNGEYESMLHVPSAVRQFTPPQYRGLTDVVSSKILSPRQHLKEMADKILEQMGYVEPAFNTFSITSGKPGFERRIGKPGIEDSIKSNAERKDYRKLFALMDELPANSDTNADYVVNGWLSKDDLAAIPENSRSPAINSILKKKRGHLRRRII